MFCVLNDLKCGALFTDEAGRLRQKVGHDPRTGWCLVHSFENGVWADGDSKAISGRGVVKVVQIAQVQAESDPGVPFVVVEYDGVAHVEEGCVA